MGKTSEAKFKVGDRVRVKAGEGTCLLFENREYTIERVSGDDVFVYRTDNEGTDFGVAQYEADRFVPVDTGPIRTVMRREIVPGVYGRLGTVNVGRIGPSNARVPVSLEERFYTGDDLRSAARIFNEIADVLDEQSAEAQKEAA